MQHSEEDQHFVPPPPYLVALAAWVVPGLGYLVLRQRSRGLTVGITILSMFVLGLLIGGVRSLEVPLVNHDTGSVGGNLGEEIRNKPWSIAQFFNGPIGVAAAGLSAFTTAQTSGPWVGYESFARVNEIAVLYTAVAGMLNLLAIIDSAHRAGRMLETA